MVTSLAFGAENPAEGLSLGAYRDRREHRRLRQEDAEALVLAGDDLLARPDHHRARRLPEVVRRRRGGACSGTSLLRFRARTGAADVISAKSRHEPPAGRDVMSEENETPALLPDEPRRGESGRASGKGATPQAHPTSRVRQAARVGSRSGTLAQSSGLSLVGIGTQHVQPPDRERQHHCCKGRGIGSDKVCAWIELSAGYALCGVSWLGCSLASRSTHV